MTLNRTALLVTTLLLAAAGQATAHAIPRSAEPAAGSILAAAPAEVVIVFTERLEGNFSGLEVRDQAGLQIDRGDAHLDPRDASRLSVGLPPLSGASRTIPASRTPGSPRTRSISRL